ncbi:VOC family protein [Georgenia faecalis]|uniref:VOC family protein n=1 Tax=Georgenia faecalis TaxID=2483799 RepID=A0ABV9D8W5_9MICO|nr:VOC family protein [Georgenia faecalis]
MTIPATLDHLLWAVPDLEAGVRDLAALTGVTAVPGGAHPGLGTANYLLALERADRPGAPRTAYLEIIGPDPAQALPAEEVNLEVGRVDRPSLHTWAVRPADLAATVGRARAQGVDVGEVRRTGRTTPDGRSLRWAMTARPRLALGGVQPFLIDWLDTPHPAEADLPVLVLRELSAVATDVAATERVLDALGAPLAVVPGAGDGLRAVLDTPRGAVELRTA